MASKKLYEEIAASLAGLSLAPSDHEIVVAALASGFAKDNRRFDEKRFREAARPVNAPQAVDPETLTRLLIDYLISCYDDTSRPSLESITEVARESVVSTLAAAKEPGS